MLIRMTPISRGPCGFPDTIMGEVVIPLDEPLPGDWQAAATVIAARTRAVIERHPWILNITDDPAIGPNNVRPDGIFDDDLVDYVTGLLSSGHYPALEALAANEGLGSAWEQIELHLRDPDRFGRNLARLLDGFAADLQRGTRRSSTRRSRPTGDPPSAQARPRA